MRNFLGNSLPPCQQELRYFQIAVVASDITNTIVQQDNLRLATSGVVHVHPSWIHAFAVQPVLLSKSLEASFAPRTFTRSTDSQPQVIHI